jgi:hypothetical protein
MPTNALADARPFTFVYDTYPHGPQGFEYEQWVTWSHGTDEDNGFNEYNFKHEFEFGLAENFDLGIYVADWSYLDTADGSDTQFEGAAVEGILYLSSPVTDFIGVGLYGEIKVGEDELEFENKLLLQKDVGPWIFAYNLVVETELEGVFDKGEENEVEGVLGHALGASYRLSDAWHVGAEATIESEFEDWSDYDATVVYAGPNASYWSESWYVTTTAMFQLTNEEDDPNFELRLIAGFQF